MSTIEFSAIPFTLSKDGCIQIQVSLMIKSPSKTVEVKSLLDVRREFHAYCLEMQATGNPYRIGTEVKKGRKPAGFDKARNELTGYVNKELAQEGGKA